ncbi:hypothetical protein L1887_29785 [Cichorium endivia]|nr:hypothetical protein L1887_29785 [Cichorium endivia]
MIRSSGHAFTVDNCHRPPHRARQQELDPQLPFLLSPRLTVANDETSQVTSSRTDLGLKQILTVISYRPPFQHSTGDWKKEPPKLFCNKKPTSTLYLIGAANKWDTTSQLLTLIIACTSLPYC